MLGCSLTMPQFGAGMSWDVPDLSQIALEYRRCRVEIEVIASTSAVVDLCYQGDSVIVDLEQLS